MRNWVNRERFTWKKFFEDYIGVGLFIACGVWLGALLCSLLNFSFDKSNYEDDRISVYAFMGIPDDFSLYKEKPPVIFRNRGSKAAYQQAIFTAFNSLKDDASWETVVFRLTGVTKTPKMPKHLQAYLESDGCRQTMVVTLPYVHGVKNLKGTLAEVQKKLVAKQDPMPIPGWSSYWDNKFLGFWLPLLFPGFILAAFISFLAESNSKQYLMDLPWNKPWPWIFTILTLPIGFPFYAVSGIRMHLHRKRDALASPMNEFSFAAVDPDGKRGQIRKNIRSNQSDDSLKIWNGLRGAARLNEWTREVERATQNVATAQVHLQQLGQKIKTTQKNLNQFKTDLAAIISSKPEEVSSENVLTFTGEYTRLGALPGVMAVNISANSPKEIVIWMQAVAIANRRQFDLGDYKIIIPTGFSREGVKVYCIYRTARNNDRHLYGGHDGEFCFGTRKGQIDELLRRGEYLPAAALCVEALNFVNPDNEDRMIRTYPEIKEVEV